MTVTMSPRCSCAAPPRTKTLLSMVSFSCAQCKALRLRVAQVADAYLLACTQPSGLRGRRHRTSEEPCSRATPCGCHACDRGRLDSTERTSHRVLRSLLG